MLSLLPFHVSDPSRVSPFPKNNTIFPSFPFLYSVAPSPNLWWVQIGVYISSFLPFCVSNASRVFPFPIPLNHCSPLSTPLSSSSLFALDRCVTPSFLPFYVSHAFEVFPFPKLLNHFNFALPLFCCTFPPRLSGLK